MQIGCGSLASGEPRLSSPCRKEMVIVFYVWWYGVVFAVVESSHRLYLLLSNLN